MEWCDWSSDVCSSDLTQKWMITVSYWMDHTPPNGGARESTQRAKGICNPVGATTLWTNQYPGALDSSCICIKRWPSRLSMERDPLVRQTLYAPVQGNARAIKSLQVQWASLSSDGRLGHLLIYMQLESRAPGYWLVHNVVSNSMKNWVGILMGIRWMWSLCNFL